MFSRILPFIASLILLFGACAPSSSAAPRPLATPNASPAAVAPSPTPEPTVLAPTVSVTAPAAIADPTTQDATESSAQAATFSAENALAHVHALAERIGSRPVGSPAADAARDYIAEELRRSGFDVATPSFPYRQTDDAGTRIRWGDEAIEAGLLVGSATGSATGEVVPAGIGRPEDFPAGRMAGNIALVERGTLTFQQKVANAERAGAAAIIVYNNVPGTFRGNLTGTAGIPALAISDTDGARLRSLAEAGGFQATVEAVQQTRDVAAYNVVGTLHGSSERTIIIGGHYDSVEAGPGANDNASGIATALEIGRVLAVQRPPATIVVVAFGAEEVGLVGSRAYVAGLSEDERRQIVAMLNFDMVGVGDRARVGGSNDLAARAIRLAREAGLDLAQFGGVAGTSSDHASFLAAGIPALFFHWLDDPNYHSPNDRAEYVGAAQLAAMGQVGVRLAMELATEQ